MKDLRHGFSAVPVRFLIFSDYACM
jgi:hypothetical protein